ncbi:MAG TPA: RT0821/Lpp0805 family surface protein [Azospirillaceae bacterium]|nr:RT0821/Lpp0805 family surface protein [Azospirillaceae bacterium]
MRHIRKTAAAALMALSLGACQTQSTGETIGTLGGAAGGALLGSQVGQGGGRIAATAIGTLAGAWAGRELARRMGAGDQQRVTSAEQTAVEQGETITWNNPETGNRGTVNPGDTYTNSAGQTCRRYTHTVYIEGRAETAQGTACRQSDGTWRLVS